MMNEQLNSTKFDQLIEKLEAQGLEFDSIKSGEAVLGWEPDQFQFIQSHPVLLGCGPNNQINLYLIDSTGAPQVCLESIELTIEQLIWEPGPFIEIINGLKKMGD